MKKILIFIIFYFFCNSVIASKLTITDAHVTSVRVYETDDDKVNVWLFINGSSRIGPNPSNKSVTCELWTHDKIVHSTALAALMSGNKVTIQYQDRGDKSYWCRVVNLTINSN